MLEKLRDSSRSFGTYLILGAIIVVFVVYFGPAGSGCDGPQGAQMTYAAKVNGKSIPVREFQVEYNRLYRDYQAQMGESFDAQMAEQFGLRNAALERVISRRLLVQQAQREGIAVADSEIAEILQQDPGFQKDGHFDYETYKVALSNWQGIRPSQYEQQIRESLLVQKLATRLRQSAKVSPEEVREAFDRENDTAELVFARFASTQFKDQARSTDAEVQSFLASEDGKAKVSQEFESKSWRYKTPKRVKAQHILVKVEEDAPQAEAEAAEQKLQAAKAEIEQGADFGEVAKRVSEDPGSKDKGGDLGFFGPGTMAKPFEDAAMALEAGELSSLVRTRFGYHLIKVNEVQPAEDKKIEDVQGEIARELLADVKAKSIAKEKAEAALAKVQAGESLEALFPKLPEDAAAEARLGSVQADRTGAFPVEGEFIPKVGMNAELSKAVAAMQAPGLIPGVHDVMGTFVVAQVVERKKPVDSEFEAQKESYEQRLLQRKEGELIEAFIQSLRDEAKVEANEALLANNF